MQKQLSIIVPIVVVLALLGLATLPTGYAQPVAGTVGQYLPLVFKPLPSPTPTDTPIPTATPVPPTATPAPVDPEALVLQPNAMPNGYAIDEQRRISNEDAVAEADNKQEAEQQFEDQGRITSYYRRYETDDLLSPAIDVAHQVILYGASEGASKGLDYFVTTRKRQGFQEIGFASLPVDRFIVLRYAPNEYFVVYSIVMQQGRYTNIIQTIAYSGASTRLSIAERYARKAIDRYKVFYP